MPKNVNDPIWAKARLAFSKTYNRQPMSDADYKITMSIYKDMGGSIEKPISRSVAQKLFGKVSRITK